MTWTTPKTWVVDELVTASLMNEQIRDNLLYLQSIHPRVAVLRDRKASGVNGGTFTAGDWRTRELNEKDDPFDMVTLNTTDNQFTLSAGIYGVTAFLPAWRIGWHVGRIYDLTNSEEYIGQGGFMATTDGQMSWVTVSAVVSIADTATFEIQHRCSNSRSNDGLGNGHSLGDNIYTIVRIMKLQ